MRYDLPIVGAKFRPPALGLLSILPAQCSLLVRREPGNQYDENAIMVLVRTADLMGGRDEGDEGRDSASNRKRLQRIDDACSGFGFSAWLITGREEWHLGYIPRQDALLVAPRMDSQDVRAVSGTLSFSATGSPKVSFSLEDSE